MMAIEKTRQEICDSLGDVREKIILGAYINEIEKKIADRKSLPHELSDIIDLSPGLGRSIQNAANSVFYRLGKKVQNTTQAIQSIGFEEIATLVRSRAIIEAFSTVKSTVSQKIIGHGISVGVASLIIAEELGVKPRANIFLAGLVHDIGKAYIAAFFPELFDKFLWVLNDPENLLGYHRLETILFGISHQETGALLLDKLGFSQDIINSTLNHHAENKIENIDLLTAIVYLGDIVCNQTGHTPFAGLTFPSVEPSLLTPVFEVKKDFNSSMLISIINSFDIEFQRLKPFITALKEF